MESDKPLCKQVKLIGPHPPLPHQLGRWLVCNDIASVNGQCHRSLSENIPIDDELIDWLAKKIIFHHYSDYRLKKLKDNYGIVGFPEYAEQHRKIPKVDRIKKGNATEILLTEYIEGCVGKELKKVYKLKYNPNVDNAIAGDDTLMVELISEKGKEGVRLYLGESKFRKKADKMVINKITSSLSKNKNPLSYSFLIDELSRDPENRKLADFLDTFIISEIKRSGNLIYTGFLLSDVNTSKYVELNLNSDNNKLIFISVSINNPEELISRAFNKAEELLSRPDNL